MAGAVMTWAIARSPTLRKVNITLYRNSNRRAGLPISGFGQLF